MYNRLLKSSIRKYHSFYHVNPKIVDMNKVENQVLGKAYELVPELGFSSKAVTTAARELGMTENTPNGLFKFTSGDLESQLVMFHLKNARQKLLELKDSAEGTELEKLRYLINARLDLNKPIVKHMSQLLGRMIQPSNIVSSMKELHNLSDDIQYYAGDRSIDFAWYSKRMAISGLYVQSELFMINDDSENFQDTKKFVDTKLKEYDTAAYAYNSFEEWTFFNAVSTVNLIKSQLARG